jgi:hypothetical protein
MRRVADGRESGRVDGPARGEAFEVVDEDGVGFRLRDRGANGGCVDEVRVELLLFRPPGAAGARSEVTSKTAVVLGSARRNHGNGRAELA